MTIDKTEGEAIWFRSRFFLAEAGEDTAALPDDPEGFLEGCAGGTPAIQWSPSTKKLDRRRPAGSTILYNQ